MKEYIEKIKDTVSILDVCNLYGIQVNRKRFIKCISHKEKTPSLKIYPKTNTFHCFGCGISGDVITFVKILFDINFYDAINKINEDFFLNIDFNRKIRKYEKIELARKCHNKKREKEDHQKKIDDIHNNYYEILKEYKRLKRNLYEFFPKDQNSEFDERFIEAAQNISYLKYKLECAEMEMDRIGE